MHSPDHDRPGSFSVPQNLAQHMKNPCRSAAARIFLVYLLIAGAAHQPMLPQWGQRKAFSSKTLPQARQRTPTLALAVTGWKGAVR